MPRQEVYKTRRPPVVGWCARERLGEHGLLWQIVGGAVGLIIEKYAAQNGGVGLVTFQDFDMIARVPPKIREMRVFRMKRGCTR